MNLNNRKMMNHPPSNDDILLCCKILASDMRNGSELLVLGFGCPVLFRGKMPGARGMSAYKMVTELFAYPNLSVVAKCWFLGYVLRDRNFVCSVFTATLTYMTGILIVY